MNSNLDFQEAALIQTEQEQQLRQQQQQHQQQQQRQRPVSQLKL